MKTTALNRARSHGLLSEAAARLAIIRHPTVIVRDDAKVKRLEAELAKTRRALALARATVYEGSPIYGDRLPVAGLTPVVALAGRSIHRPVGHSPRRWWQFWK